MLFPALIGFCNTVPFGLKKTKTNFVKYVLYGVASPCHCFSQRFKIIDETLSQFSYTLRNVAIICFLVPDAGASEYAVAEPILDALAYDMSRALAISSNEMRASSSSKAFTHVCNQHFAARFVTFHFVPTIENSRFSRLKVFHPPENSCSRRNR